MKNIAYAARFATLIGLAATVWTVWQLQPALLPLAFDPNAPDHAAAIAARQSWYTTHVLAWQTGWWLWLGAIFTWMWLLVVLGWSYLPAHRVAGVLQSGLMGIAAVLAIAGVQVWMVLLPFALAPVTPDAHLAVLVEMLARTLVGAGLMMGGITTAWIAFDHLQYRHLPRPWLALLLASGVASTLAPFLALNGWLLLIAAGGWLLFSGWLATRPALPDPFPTWQR